MSSSWFPLSLPNPFSSDDDQFPTAAAAVLTQSLGRQLHNVASFLTPPPSSSSSPSTTTSPEETPSSSSSTSPTQGLLGLRNDLAEIGGSFKTGLSLLSSNKAVSEISKFASNFLQFDDEVDFEPVGITDEVVDFVREISLRPECWTDFPLSLRHKDFNMSDIQKDHATNIEQLVPSLTALRHKINNYVTEEQFWVIYFILLLPRLNEVDYKLLSTPEIVEVREILLWKLRNKMNKPVEVSEDTSEENQGEPEARSSSETSSKVNDMEQIKNSYWESRSPFEDANATQRIENEDLENSNSLPTQQQDEDDASFSDTEDEDNDLSGERNRQARSSNVSSPSETGDWVRLNETTGTLDGQQKAGEESYCERHSEGEESNDWLTVDDVDFGHPGKAV